jgi:hypothetical protein
VNQSVKSEPEHKAKEHEKHTQVYIKYVIPPVFGTLQAIKLPQQKGAKFGTSAEFCERYKRAGQQSQSLLD